MINLHPLRLLGIALLAFSCTPAPRDDSEKWAKETLANLSLEKKAAQLVFVDINGNYVADDDARLAFWLSLAREHGIGGFVIYGGTPHSIAMLLNKLQREAEIPILISTDFEGGAGQQVTGASEFPSNMAFAATRDEDLMYRAARTMAAEGKAMGIHLSYTPVSDLSLSPDNPQESGRSFGGDVDLMGKMVRAYVKGYREAGMLTTAKHFPGRGDMKADGNAYPSFTTLNKSMDELEANEFQAFRNAIEAGVDFIMTEHIAIPSITGGSTTPASVEPRLIKGIIRDKLKFNGIITSDDLWYDHVIARFGREDIAVKALEAGHDLVLKPKDPVATIAAIAAAVKGGRLTLAQIDSAVLKLLRKKAQLGLHKNRLVNVDSISTIVGTAEKKALVQEVADRSVTLLRNNEVLPLKSFDPAKSVHIAVQKEDDQPNVKLLVKEMSSAFPAIKQFTLRPALSQSYVNEVRKAAAAADLVIVSLLVQRDRHGDPSPLRPEDLNLIQDIITRKPGKVVAMSFGNPHHIRKMPGVSAFLVGYGEGGFYGNQPAYFTSWVKILKGDLNPSGKLSIKVSDDLPIGFGLSY